MELGLRPPLADDAGIVCAFVIILEARQHFSRAMHAVGLLFAELIGDRQEQCDESALVLWIDAKNVKADALGRRRVIEQAIALRLLQRGRHSLTRDRLQFHRRLLPTLRLLSPGIELHESPDRIEELVDDPLLQW